MVLPVALLLFQLAIPAAPSAPSPVDARAVVVSADAAKPEGSELFLDSAPSGAASASDAPVDGNASSSNAGTSVAVVQPGSADASDTFSSSRSFAPASIISTADEAQEQHRWVQRQKRIWLGLSIAQSSAAAFDGYSTRMVIGSGRGTEINPMLRPFSGNASMYAAIEVGPVLIDYVSRRMLESHRGWMRRGWWIPQVTGTVVSLFSGARNMGIYTAQ